MKIDKAIERLQDSLDHNTILLTLGDKDALRLSIEALKEIKHLRKSQVLHDDELLPGETKD